MPTIRKAISRDIPGMVRLLESLFSIEEDFIFEPEVHTRAFTRIIEQNGNNNAAFVITVKDGEVCGMLTVQTVVSTATGELSGWVEDVVIDDAWQSQGLGKALLQHAEAWSLERGITRLQLLADKDNHGALGFYEHQGWISSNMIHRKKMLR